MDAAAALAFERAYGARATREARAPGRVNLIGEHVDYCGLAVLPMAIEQEVRIIFTPRGDARVRIVNVDAGRFGAREFTLALEVEYAQRGDWSNYVRAAAQELAARFELRRGIDACVYGDVPLAAGLSSSSAMVVASTLALLEANDIRVPIAELMELCARAERHVGTDSGGMDQAVSLGGRVGCALLVDFDPVRTRAIAIPDAWRFVIANSGVGAEKSGRAREAYNARVAECREALRLTRAHPLATGWPGTWRQLVATLPEDELLAVGARALDGDLARRFRHVITEGFRVERAVLALERDDAAEFGRLMDLSHASLRDDHAVSCAELEACVAVAHQSGALGARLTGAGFGGSIVALAYAKTASAVESALRSSAGPSSAADAVFVARASGGASVTRT